MQVFKKLYIEGNREWGVGSGDENIDSITTLVWDIKLPLETNNYVEIRSTSHITSLLQ